MAATVIGAKWPETVNTRPARITVAFTLGRANAVTAAVTRAKGLGAILTCPTLLANTCE